MASTVAGEGWTVMEVRGGALAKVGQCQGYQFSPESPAARQRCRSGALPGRRILRYSLLAACQAKSENAPAAVSQGKGIYMALHAVFRDRAGGDAMTFTDGKMYRSLCLKLRLSFVGFVNGGDANDIADRCTLSERL